MDIHFAGIVLGIHRALGQMFFHRRARPVGIFVEEEQAFGQRTVIQALALQQIGNDSFVFAGCDKGGDAFAFVLFALRVEGGIESELLDFVEELLLECRRRLVVFSRKEFIQVLEHTACRARSGDEFHNLFVFCQISIPRIHIRSLFVLRDDFDAFFH